MRHFKHRVGPTLASYRVANKYVAGFATVGPTNPMLSGYGLIYITGLEINIDLKPASRADS